jgi:hypothetical protein
VIRIEMEGFREKATVPRFERVVIEAAVNEAVRTGKLWLMSGTASILGERVPMGLLNDNAVLKVPPPPIPAEDVLPESLPAAWSGASTTGAAILTALQEKTKMATLPWGAARAALDEAIRAGLLEVAPNSGAWPCDTAGAGAVRLQKPSKRRVMPKITGAQAVEAELDEAKLRKLAERLDAIREAADGHDVRFFLRVETGGERKVPDKALRALRAILGEVSEEFKLESVS